MMNIDDGLDWYWPDDVGDGGILSRFFMSRDRGIYRNIRISSHSHSVSICVCIDVLPALQIPDHVLDHDHHHISAPRKRGQFRSEITHLANFVSLPQWRFAGLWC